MTNTQCKRDHEVHDNKESWVKVLQQQYSVALGIRLLCKSTCY